MEKIKNIISRVTGAIKKTLASIRKRFTRRTVIIITILVVSLIVVVAFIGNRAQKMYQEQIADLQTVEAEYGTLVATVGATGTVRANQTALLAWKTSGTVDEVYSKVGDEVKEGDVLAELDLITMPQNVILAAAEVVSAQNDLQALLDAHNELAIATAAQVVTQAETAVENAETYLENVSYPASQKYIDQAEASMILAREELEQAQEDWDKGSKTGNEVARANLQNLLSIAQQNYDSAVTRYNNLVNGGDALDIASAQADLEVAKETLNQAKEDYDEVVAGPDPDDLEAAEARVAAAKATLEMSKIVAPFDGTVTQADPMVGDQVNTGTSAFRLDDLSHLLVDVEISEVDINRIEVGQEVTLTFDAIQSKEYKGKLLEVDLAGVEIQGIVNFGVIIELLDADELVKPGMTTGVNIVVNKLENVLSVPNRAVRVYEDKRYVYVLDIEQGLQMIEVELGASSYLYSEVIGGDLKPGDMIVLNPPAVPMSGPPGGHPSSFGGDE